MITKDFITPSIVKMMCDLSPEHVEQALENGGYFGCDFEEVKFRGLNVDTHFVYECKYYDNIEGTHEQVHVYVKWDHNKCKITADF